MRKGAGCVLEEGFRENYKKYGISMAEGSEYLNAYNFLTNNIKSAFPFATSEIMCKIDLIREDRWKEAEEVGYSPLAVGMKDACCELVGISYFYGIGLPQDYEKAAYYLEIEKTHTLLVDGVVGNVIAYMWYHGLGVSANREKFNEFCVTQERWIKKLSDTPTRIDEENRLTELCEKYKPCPSCGTSWKEGIPLVHCPNCMKEGGFIKVQNKKLSEEVEEELERVDFDELEEQAELGEISAQILWVRYYNRRVGVEKNKDKYLKYLGNWLKTEDPAATIFYVFACFDEYLEEKDKDKKETYLMKAIQYAKVSAQQGEYGGYETLATFYKHGKGGAEDKGKALELYQESVALGSRTGLKGIGDIYLHGLGGIEVDVEKAREVLEEYLETDENDGEALCWMGESYCRTGYADEELAISYFEQAIEAGNAQAYYELGMLFYSKNMLGTDEDTTKALALFRTGGEEMNSCDCLLKLVEIYKTHGVTQNEEKRWEGLHHIGFIPYLLRAVGLGSPKALYLLGEEFCSDDIHCYFVKDKVMGESYKKDSIKMGYIPE